MIMKQLSVPWASRMLLVKLCLKIFRGFFPFLLLIVHNDVLKRTLSIYTKFHGEKWILSKSGAGILKKKLNSESFLAINPVIIEYLCCVHKPDWGLGTD